MQKRANEGIVYGNLGEADLGINSLSRILVGRNKEMPTTLLVEDLPEAFSCFQSSLSLNYEGCESLFRV